MIARHLELRGIAVRVLLLADPKELTGDAAANYQIIEKAGLPNRVRLPLDPATSIPNCQGVVGGCHSGNRRNRRAEIAAGRSDRRMNASGVPILAVDLPSGLDCDTGAAAKHTIRAAHTCTFVAAKPGFFAPGAEQYVGQLHVLDIGVPRN